MCYFNYFIHALTGTFTLAGAELEEVSLSGPNMVFARLFLTGGFFELGCFWGALREARRRPYSLPMRWEDPIILHRFLDSFKSSPIRKLQWYYDLVSCLPLAVSSAVSAKFDGWL